ncbi:periplasmic chaperone for outer membrane proteins Skp [Palleronia aestuarii]|uniref:Periplasmic chaperone for outer membrane proteins Skp n=1 Tax=Palleronia aestuarii TaxID=568105 RepID=A0A2W7QDG7_9RHOB|nr:OmpH family outer membrane protein [Palleronia aestuarii]PZX19909.1 periplasmic chaperone for outer membrane proteins Skp [Palleronia aestuarii]
MALGLALSLPAAGQTPDPSPVVVVDQDRLFDDSLFGKRILVEIDRRSEELAAENRRIETELIAQERALTDQRDALPPEVFRERAEAFDSRVTTHREEQDAKARALGRRRDEARQEFYGQITGVLTEIIAERGARVLLDRRAVLAATEAVDITDTAIERIDAAIGDGSGDPSADTPPD